MAEAGLQSNLQLLELLPVHTLLLPQRVEQVVPDKEGQLDQTPISLYMLTSQMSVSVSVKSGCSVG